MPYPNIRPTQSVSQFQGEYFKRNLDKQKAIQRRWIQMIQKLKKSVSHSVVSNSSPPHGLQHTRHLCPRNSPGKNTVLNCHFLLQGIFPTQGSNPGLLHCRQILHCLSHQGSHRISYSKTFLTTTLWNFPTGKSMSLGSFHSPSLIQLSLSIKAMSTFTP